MSQFAVLALVVAVSLGGQPADDKASGGSDRAVQLSAIQSEFKKANDDLVKSIRVGAIKPDANGEYREWTEIQRRFAKQARGLIDADPADAVGLDAIVFCLSDLQAGESERDLYEVLVKHHAASEKIDPLIRSPLAPPGIPAVDRGQVSALQNPPVGKVSHGCALQRKWQVHRGGADLGGTLA